MKTIFLLILSLATCVSIQSAAAMPSGKAFATPEEAINAMERATRDKDPTQIRSIFGPEVENISNPDPVERTNEVATVANAMKEHKRLVKTGEGRMILEYGDDRTLFPVPLVKKGSSWYFDTAAGEEELINRRIGRHELETLEVIRTYIAAQREYALKDRDGDDVLEFAQRFGSTPGKKDGLYWQPDVDGTMSPLGPLAAEAEAAGYTRRTDNQRQSLHGYYFRILTRQGKTAAGGAYDYIINGNMIGGFGLIAWPAEYDETGVMTFIVNQQGVIYQKDLGPKTSEAVEAIKSYDPDKTWSLSAD